MGTTTSQVRTPSRLIAWVFRRRIATSSGCKATSSVHEAKLSGCKTSTSKSNSAIPPDGRPVKKHANNLASQFVTAAIVAAEEGERELALEKKRLRARRRRHHRLLDQQSTPSGSVPQSQSQSSISSGSLPKSSPSETSAEGPSTAASRLRGIDSSSSCACGPASLSSATCSNHPSSSSFAQVVWACAQSRSSSQKSSPRACHGLRMPTTTATLLTSTCSPSTMCGQNRVASQSSRNCSQTLAVDPFHMIESLLTVARDHLASLDLVTTSFTAADLRLSGVHGPGRCNDSRPSDSHWSLPVQLLRGSARRLLLSDLQESGYLRLSARLSSLHRVTMHGDMRQDAGIPVQAEYCAWSYPALPAKQLRGAVSSSRNTDVAFLAYGGFMYFNRSLDLCEITAAIPCQDGSLCLGAPQLWLPECIRGMEHHRFVEVTNPALLALGAESYCWLSPDDQLCIGSKYASHTSRHGGFIYNFKALNEKSGSANPMHMYMPVLESPPWQSQRSSRTAL